MTRLEELPTTDSGHIKKADATRWMDNLPDVSTDDVLDAIKPKTTTHSGSSYPSDVSNIRVTGDPEFIEKFAGLMKSILDYESETTRLEIKLQQTKDNDSGQFTNNYALYLSVAERG